MMFVYSFIPLLSDLSLSSFQKIFTTISPAQPLKNFCKSPSLTCLTFCLSYCLSLSFFFSPSFSYSYCLLPWHCPVISVNVFIYLAALCGHYKKRKRYDRMLHIKACLPRRVSASFINCRRVEHIKHTLSV